MMFVQRTPTVGAREIVFLEVLAPVMAVNLVGLNDKQESAPPEPGHIFGDPTEEAHQTYRIQKSEHYRKRSA